MTIRSLAALSVGALSLAAAGIAAASVVKVNQVGTSFVPANVTVDPGDTVQWIHSAGTHTVTSGTDPLDPQMGVLFNGNLSIATPTFSFVFNTPGVYPYFCSPHFTFGMVGTVTVNQPTSVGSVEAASWSRVKNLYR